MARAPGTGKVRPRVRLRQLPHGVISLLLLGSLLAPGAASAAENDIRAADQAAGKWLALVDGRQYREAWQQAASLFRRQVSIADWEHAVGAARQPLGSMRRRKLIAATFVESLPGAPDGAYVVLQFETEFEHRKRAIETVTPMLDGEAWRVSGYYVRQEP